MQQNQAQPVYYRKADDAFEAARQQARDTFGYFWRELYFERHRIVHALAGAFVKAAFAQQINGEDVVEHMWLRDPWFDGDTITADLINQPDNLTNVRQGDRVTVPFGQVSDWLIMMQGHTLGGFTIQLMRRDMNPQERFEHDKAWGIDFGDPDQIQVVYEQAEHPENLVEHPMCVNTAKIYREQMVRQMTNLEETADDGLTELLCQALAGNLPYVQALVEAGANLAARSRSGKTALGLARQLHWPHVAAYLESVGAPG
jgi:uncharacterized protein YegJ (DUF2314 family)